MIGFRKTEEKDVDAVVAIIEEARHFFKVNGIPQWQDPHPGETHLYPGKPDVLKDIAKGISYVLDDDGVVVGTCCISFDPDPNYTVIDGGEWLNDRPYGVIHRIAVKADRKGTGLSKEFFRQAEVLAKEKGITDLRGDTHVLNIPMNGLFRTMGYRECGTVYMADGAPRAAYHKVLG